MEVVFKPRLFFFSFIQCPKRNRLSFLYHSIVDKFLFCWKLSRRKVDQSILCFILDLAWVRNGLELFTFILFLIKNKKKKKKKKKNSKLNLDSLKNYNTQVKTSPFFLFFLFSFFF
jgi:hypothetical protein